MEQPEVEQTCSILILPLEIISEIFSCLTFEEIGKIRGVCKVFNEIGSSILNSTFNRQQTLLQTRCNEIKSLMPRRESSRRNHPLARQWEIFENIHLRLTTLNLTFGKHIKRNTCCFFAGKILDEVNGIYNHVSSSSNLGYPFKVTDELFDLTNMANEYFRECIEPKLPDVNSYSSDLLKVWLNVIDDLPLRDTINTTLNKRLKRLRQRMRRNNVRMIAFKRRLNFRTNQLLDQQKQISDFSVRLDDYDKKSEESALKFNCIFQELSKCKSELQYWKSHCYNCNTTSHEIAIEEDFDQSVMSDSQNTSHCAHEATTSSN